MTGTANPGVELRTGPIGLGGRRRFMDTYGQELGFSLAQMSIRAGHDPAVASKHHTGRATSPIGS